MIKKNLQFESIGSIWQHIKLRNGGCEYDPKYPMIHRIEKELNINKYKKCCEQKNK